MKKYVAYYRVSTAKQGASGLGLDAQQTSIAAFIKDAPLIAAFTEIESGKKNLRPKLIAAIATAKSNGAVLVIAKLDRLSRNAGFIFALRDSGVDFVAADMPDANTLTVGIFAVIAQHEREIISKRTKDALQARVAKGGKLGTPKNLTESVRQQGLQTRQRNARENSGSKQATALIVSRKAQNASFNQIAAELNSLGFTARRGGTFNQKQVQRLYDRAVHKANEV